MNEPINIVLLGVFIVSGSLCWFCRSNIREWWEERYRPFESTNARMRRKFPELTEEAGREVPE